MDLSRRELAVLVRIVELNIRTGQAVASRSVARSPVLGLSAATVRNIMAGLEEAGWLARSHPSAGCTPTDRAYRLYADTVAGSARLTPAVRQYVSTRIGLARSQLLDDLDWVARLTAELTREAGVAVRPMGEASELEALSIVPLSDDRLLGVVVTGDGSVEKRLVPADDDGGSGLADELAQLVTAFRGVDLDRIRHQLAVALEEQGPWRRPFTRRAARVAGRLLSERTEDVEMWVVGTDNLLASSDFSQVDRVRSLLATLDDRAAFAREWRRVFERGRTQVLIGRESPLTAGGCLAMVATLYYRRGRRAGAVGVVGSSRMNYGRIVPVVECIGQTLTDLMEEPGAAHA